MYRRRIGTLLAETGITEHPEVRVHLAHLEAQHRRRFADAPPAPRKAPAALTRKTFTLTVPLSAEMIAAFKAAETDGTLHIDMTALPGAVPPPTPGHKPRRPPSRRRAAGAAANADAGQGE